MCNLGVYVEYKNIPYMVVHETAKQVKINSPSAKMVQVNKSNVRKLSLKPAHKISIKGSKYLCTDGGSIFSCTTGKEMQWPADHGIRVAIYKHCGVKV